MVGQEVVCTEDRDICGRLISVVDDGCIAVVHVTTDKFIERDCHVPVADLVAAPGKPKL